MLDAADILDLEFEVSNDLGKIMFLLKGVELLFLTFLRIVLHNFARTDFVITEVLASFLSFVLNKQSFPSVSEAPVLCDQKHFQLDQCHFYVCHHNITQRVQI